MNDFKTFWWNAGAINLRCDRQCSPLLIKSPLPNHGLKKRYSSDLSMCTELPRMISTSLGCVKNTINFGPIQILAKFVYTLLNSNANSKISSHTHKGKNEKFKDHTITNRNIFGFYRCAFYSTHNVHCQWWVRLVGRGFYCQVLQCVDFASTHVEGPKWWIRKSLAISMGMNNHRQSEPSRQQVVPHPAPFVCFVLQFNLISPLFSAFVG